MVTQVIELVTAEQVDEYIAQAAKAAGYEQGFGITGCDLAMPVWWAAYCRQSLDQQSHNNRLPEYLLTMARLAKDQGVVVPREYVLYDHVSGEHLDRPGMHFLRRELVERKRVLGIFFADLRCLSREPAPQQVFERECEIRGVKLVFGDAPSGTDIGSQFARSAITFSNKMTRLATNSNARAGNIGRVLKGSVPACKAAYGYVYRREAEITNGRILVKKAWWDIDSTGTDNKPAPGSPADAVVKIFHWLGNESRTCYWVARKLNELGYKGPAGGRWTGNTLRRVVINHCYTGSHAYNANARVPNPSRPLGDVTGLVKRTLTRPKPASEVVSFEVPSLVTEDLWQRANQAMHQRGRGGGKEGKTIKALLRNRIFCPRCGRPMSVRRRSGGETVYYRCARAHNIFLAERCGYRPFVPGDWDNVDWDAAHALLKQDAWVEERLGDIGKQNEDSGRLIKLEQHKIAQLQTKIARVREGFEGGLYSLDEAKARLSGYQEQMAKAEREIQRSEKNHEMAGNSAVNIDKLKSQLRALADENLSNATFEEKLEIVTKLCVHVYPTEDLKTARIRFGLPLHPDNGNITGDDPERCRIITLGSTGSPRTVNKRPHVFALRSQLI